LGDQERVLPFSEGEGFEGLEQEIAPTGITYRCRSEALGVEVDLRIVAPFYPQDVPTSIVPAFIVRVQWHPIVHPGEKPVEGPGRLTIKFTGDAASLKAGAEPLRWSDEFTLSHPWHKEGVAPLSGSTFRGEFCLRPVLPQPVSAEAGSLSFDLAAGETATLILAAHCGDQVLDIVGEKHRFKYASLWQDVDSVAAYVRDDLGGLLDRSEFFDEVLGGASLGKSALDLIAFSLQCYLQNTWWTQGPGGDDWFSCWEGNCTFHSTIDVEYNLAWFYLLLWPELLEMTFDQWARHEKFGLPEQKPLAVAYNLAPGEAPPAETSWLSHDMGALLEATGQNYPHEMELEENCNFLLLLHALAHFTGNEDLFGKHFAMVKRLCRYIFASDTTGNGVPNLGVANTIDDASAAVQYSREQVYLAFKCYAALQAAAAMADSLDEGSFARECREFAALTEKTLQAQAWLGDHYAVCLERSAEGLNDVWTGAPLTGELEGWDAYHIYSANGFLFLLATGFGTPTDYDRLRLDLSTATAAAMCEYGDFHSSADHSNLWVSQNLHRDFTAAYLGLDQLNLAERYWAFQLLENTTGRGGAFVDTYGFNHLHYYPRGITSLGLYQALGGVRLSKLDGRLIVAPVRVPCRTPLLSLADWKARRVPWLNARLVGGVVSVEISDDDLLEGLDIQGP
jgi:hypothetical protein